MSRGRKTKLQQALEDMHSGMDYQTLKNQIDLLSLPNT